MVESILLADIDPVPAFAVRAKSDPDTVERYREAYLANEPLPPVKVFRCGSWNLLADGGHRLEGRKAAGFAKIDADVIICDTRDECDRLAWEFAFQANISHGLARSKEDRRVAIATCIMRPFMAEASDNTIAKACGMKYSPVIREVREKLAAQGMLTGSAMPGSPGRKPYTAGIRVAGGYISDGVGGRIPVAPRPENPKVAAAMLPAEDDTAAPSTPTSRTPTQPTLDAKGRPVPSAVAAAFNGRSWFKERAKELSLWICSVRDMKGHPHTAATFMNDIDARLSELKSAFMAGEPFVVCPECGDLDVNQKCGCCLGRGWIARGGFSLLTDSQRKVVAEWEKSQKGGNTKYQSDDEAA